MEIDEWVNINENHSNLDMTVQFPDVNMQKEIQKKKELMEECR
jgi:hypothetical protein